ncbi:hypothetical protein OPV22_031926 [Ensete ventricosum]|uniref:Uncharacterized protein n=1 Tax=Ensete ventricosum TaxID=4639 RepID=A0AAV8PW00_ENSVE|nr:hypothetical protein OPV22_031926 [Ensete ventricosum]
MNHLLRNLNHVEALIDENTNRLRGFLEIRLSIYEFVRRPAAGSHHWLLHLSARCEESPAVAAALRQWHHRASEAPLFPRNGVAWDDVLRVHEADYDRACFLIGDGDQMAEN